MWLQLLVFSYSKLNPQYSLLVTTFSVLGLLLLGNSNKYIGKNQSLYVADNAMQWLVGKAAALLAVL